MRAPEAPMGCPMDTAPPWTLTVAGSRASLSLAYMVTTAKASLTSQSSMSLAERFVFLSSLSTANFGAVVNHSGSWAKEAWPTMRTMGVRPSSAALSALITTRAAPPSLMEEALAAVTVPSLSKAGRNEGIFSGLPRPGSSSLSMVTTPLRPLISTGTISASSQPSFTAFTLRA